MGEGKVNIKPSKILYFNRVAKTGSQSFIRLLVHQGEKLGFHVDPKIRQNDILADDPFGLIEEAISVLKIQRPEVVVRHYNFIDFKEFSHGWHPDWFNVVRDPIDKVSLMILSQFLL